MDLSKLKDLIDLMNRHQLEEIEVEEEGQRVRLRKQGGRGPETYAAAAPAAAAAPLATPAAQAAAPAAEQNLIRSPMVDTFYRTPSPDADPFVEVGDQVEEGKVLCIIEAMKVMNEIKAERSGKIEEIFPANGASVEYGMPLFRVS